MSVATQAIPRECFFPGPISSISWLAHQCLVCNLRNFPDEVLNNIPTHTWKVGKNRRQTQATPGRQVAVIRRKETYLGGLSWAAPSRGDLYMRRVLEVYIETSRGSRDAYQPHGPRSTSLARLLPPNGSGFGNGIEKCTRAGEGPGASHPALGSMGGHGLWMTSSGIKCNQFTHQV